MAPSLCRAGVPPPAAVGAGRSPRPTIGPRTPDYRADLDEFLDLALELGPRQQHRPAALETAQTNVHPRPDDLPFVRPTGMRLSHPDHIAQSDAEGFGHT
jgi:hypothetical protein